MHDATATTALDLEALIGPRGRPLLEVRLAELARRRQETARPWEGLGFRMEDGDDDDGDDDDGDDKAGKDDDDDDDDEDVSDLGKAQAAVAKYRREARDLRRAADDAKQAALKDQGKHKERADELEKELADLRSEQEATVKGNLLREALKLAGFKNPETGLKLAKADDLVKDVEDEHDAKRIARKLAKENADLVDKKPRQKRRDEDDDDRDDDEDDRDDDDDRTNGRRRRSSSTKDQPRGVDRIRAALDKESAKSKRK